MARRDRSHIEKAIMVKSARIGMSRGFGEFEKRKREVEVISASKRWLTHIKKWDKSFREDVGDLNKYRVYRYRPQMFEQYPVVGELWGALVTEQDTAENLCKLGSFGEESQPGMVVKLVLEENKRLVKKEKKSGKGSKDGTRRTEGRVESNRTSH